VDVIKARERIAFATDATAEVAPSAVAVATAAGQVRLTDVSVFYGAYQAVRDVSVQFSPRSINAIIGPSGCGKSSLLRAIDRMHEVTPGGRVTGTIELDGRDIYARDVSAVRVRRAIGMVFQRPNPFPAMSIFDNVASGPRLGGGAKGARIEEIVEDSLRRAALWDQVKDRLGSKAQALSGGQQQRLCIARALAVKPRVLLMDEPCSSLDQIATRKIEDLVRELSQQITIVIVTHNLQQAARLSDTTSFFVVDDDRTGFLVETGSTDQVFSHPHERLTEDYVAGRFG
jgi:phosphate transport system ATP-binding protein